MRSVIDIMDLSVEEIDKLLASTGSQIMTIIAAGNDVENKIAALKERNDALIIKRNTFNSF